MNPEIFTHYGNRLRNRVKIAIEKTKILLNITKNHTIISFETSYFYAKEIKQQAKVFRANFNQINKYDYEQPNKYYN